MRGAFVSILSILAAGSTQAWGVGKTAEIRADGVAEADGLASAEDKTSGIVRRAVRRGSNQGADVATRAEAESASPTDPADARPSDAGSHSVSIAQHSQMEGDALVVDDHDGIHSDHSTSVAYYMTQPREMCPEGGQITSVNECQLAAEQIRGRDYEWSKSSEKLFHDAFSHIPGGCFFQRALEPPAEAGGAPLKTFEVIYNTQTVMTSIPDHFGYRCICKATWGAVAKQCSMGGDPHTRTFDAWESRHPKDWHPSFAPGAWWLVRTPEVYDHALSAKSRDVEVQALYGKCGVKGVGGWMSARKYGSAPTCTVGVGVAGKFLLNSEGVQYKLIVQPPCEWDWDNKVCTNPGVTVPRINICHEDGCASTAQFKDGKYTLDDPKIEVTLSGRTVLVELPRNMHLRLTMGGDWYGVPAWTYMNVILKMRKHSAGRGHQCGHCGDFNGNQNDDFLYGGNGLLKVESPKGGLCDPSVERSEMITPRCSHCAGASLRQVSGLEESGPLNNATGASVSLDTCPEEIMKMALDNCNAAFATAHVNHTKVYDAEFLDCLLDECLLPGSNMSTDDAAEAAAETEEENARTT